MGLHISKKRLLLFLKRAFIIGYVAVSLLAFIFIGYDVILKLDGRITSRKLGRFSSRTEWISAVKEKAIDEYKDMPRLMGNLGFPRLITQFKIDKYAPLYAWQTGGLLLGLYECMTEEEFAELVNERKDLHQMTGEEIDSALLAYALSFLPNEEYMSSDRIRENILEDIEACTDAKTGTIMYREVYPSFRFVDTIGLVCPYLAVLGREEEYSRYTDLAVRQILEFEDLAFDEDYDYLPFHAYDLDTETPLGKYGWGRGTGWYALGLIDTYSLLEESERARLRDSIVRLAQTLKKYQKEDGGWGSTINVVTSQTDTSATALFLYFIKKAGSLGVIDLAPYEACIEGAEGCLMMNTHPDGRVMNTEGDCIAIGNYSYDYKHMPFTQGMTLRAVCLDD